MLFFTVPNSSPLSVQPVRRRRALINKSFANDTNENKNANQAAAEDASACMHLEAAAALLVFSDR
jgi:hypothetical protein